MIDNDICKDKAYTIDQHHSILNAIVKQDAEAAGAAMVLHLIEIVHIRMDIE